MSKPTLFQTLLNRPSQTYYNPTAHQQLQRNDYHSAKQDMLRIAQAAASNPGPSQVSYTTFNSNLPVKHFYLVKKAKEILISEPFLRTLASATPNLTPFPIQNTSHLTLPRVRLSSPCQATRIRIRRHRHHANRNGGL